MKRACAWHTMYFGFELDMGEVEPIGKGGVTHSICNQCALKLEPRPVRRFFGLLAFHIREFLWQWGVYKRCPVCKQDTLVPHGGQPRWTCENPDCGWGKDERYAIKEEVN
jgi:hypothetical protein